MDSKENNMIYTDQYCKDCYYYGDRIQCPYFDFVFGSTDWRKFGCTEFWGNN